MIKRYTLPPFDRIWSDEYKFSLWLRIEIAVCETLAARGAVPEDALQRIKEKASFSVSRIEELEKTLRHDVIAFLTNVAEYVGADSRHIHIGMTSSDLLDTTLALQLVEASVEIRRALAALLESVEKRALEEKYTFMMGRTHGMHAEPITFGLKLAHWYDDLRRAAERFENAALEISCGKLSGAVGNFVHLDPEIEEEVCTRLGLRHCPISSQVIGRDRHAAFLSSIALLACILEKVAVEIRGLQKTEVRELEEPFRKGQKGSSAMPHKRNPILCERIAGSARLIRANLIAALENITLWHERDISHSSVERIILPDTTTLIHYLLVKMKYVIDDLNVYRENMMRNIQITGGLFHSQDVLLKLTSKGLGRNEAYDIVQEAAMKAWKTGTPFQDIVTSDGKISSYLDQGEIEETFSLDRYARNVDKIFMRIGLREK
jgi:adenylosuccinate lyase